MCSVDNSPKADRALPLQKNTVYCIVPRVRRPYRLGVRTAPFQGVNPGSNPGRVTTAKNSAALQSFLHFVKMERCCLSTGNSESGAGDQILLTVLRLKEAMYFCGENSRATAKQILWLIQIRARSALMPTLNTT